MISGEAKSHWKSIAEELVHVGLTTKDVWPSTGRRVKPGACAGGVCESKRVGRIWSSDEVLATSEKSARATN